MSFPGFHERLDLVFKDLPSRQIADVIGINPEVIRRVQNGGAPTTDFVIAVCSAMDVNADWLLMGRGTMRASEVRLDALKRVPATDLIGSLTVCLRRMTEGGERAIPSPERAAESVSEP